MSAGDIEVYIADVDDDGTKLDTVLTGNGIVVADKVTMTSLNGSRVVVMVVKAA